MAKKCTKQHEIASQMNEYFSFVCDLLQAKQLAFSPDSMRPICLLMGFQLFTLLYLIKDNLIGLIQKEPSIEKTLLTLHVTAEMHFLLRKSLKNIMHGLVKMYVMC